MTIQPQTSAPRPPQANAHGAFNDEGIQLTQFLDKAIPLKDANHGDIVGYGVHTPFWHSECYAVTAEGEKIAFANKHCFLGWSGRNPIASLLFQYGDSQLELMLLSDRSTPGPVADINLVNSSADKLFNRGTYIGLTGAPM